MKTFALAAVQGRTSRARGIMGRLMNSSAGKPTDLASVMAAFGTYHDEVKAMHDDLRAQGKTIDEIVQTQAAFKTGGAGDGPNRRRDLAPFASYLRAGALDVKAGMTTSDDTKGGVFVPQTIDGVIQNQLVPLSPLRAYATIITLGQGAGRYSFAVNRRGATSGWVGETTARPETNTPLLGVITPAEGEVYANPKVSQWLLDDSSFNVETFLQDNVSDEFSVQEDAAFVNGNGQVKPQGFMTYPTALTADAARAFGTIQYLKTGAADSFPNADADVPLINLVYALRAPYRAGAGVAWMMNSTTASVIRQFKDGNGRYIWADSLQAGQPAMLLGYPVAIDENMADIGAGTLPIAFGNWKLGYRIVDRLGVRMLRDPFTEKPFVYFYTTKRVGGAVADSNAIKFLKCEA